MPAKRFDQARPFLTLAVVAAAWLAVPVVVKTLARASFFELTAPIAATASHIRDLQEYWSLRSHTNRELIEAGRDLARVNASYELTTQQNSELQSEIGRLEADLRLPRSQGTAWNRPGWPSATFRAGGSAWSSARGETMEYPWTPRWFSPGASWGASPAWEPTRRWSS